MLFPECTINLVSEVVELSPATEYDPRSGMSINRACDELMARVVVEGRPWAMVFNGRRVVGRPGDVPDDVLARWAAGRLE